MLLPTFASGLAFNSTSQALQMIISMKREVALMDPMNDDNASER